MEALIDYLRAHAERGACRCGKCFDAPENPEEHQPAGHTANVEFYEVSAKAAPNADVLRELIQQNEAGEFATVDLFDGKEHSYLELGGWIGDQGLALTLMGLGSLLGLWKLLTPTSIFGSAMPKEQAMQLAGMGMVAIQA